MDKFNSHLGILTKESNIFLCQKLTILVLKSFSRFKLSSFRVVHSLLSSPSKIWGLGLSIHFETQINWFQYAIDVTAKDCLADKATHLVDVPTRWTSFDTF